MGLLVVFGGYSVAFYGVTQVMGYNYGFLDLVVPGRWAKASSNPRDPGATGGGQGDMTTTTKTAIAKTGSPTTGGSAESDLGK